MAVPPTVQHSSFASIKRDLTRIFAFDQAHQQGTAMKPGEKS